MSWRSTRKNLLSLLYVCGRIALDAFLSIAIVVRDLARLEIDIVPDDSRTPRRHQELGEGALARLVGSQRPDERIAVERWDVDTARDQRCPLRHYRSFVRDIHALAG